ncbi:hypothetical protein HJG60_010316 [Phyllostomus discolor]|uniref:Uncharacterized protein n=1 Tax=Phyllostomus discolor TaxID=89673 RepID=A0A834AWK0_9CHIR|nr:hypothetical protein HJG60_010316 [Phyllostomus discolor]
MDLKCTILTSLCEHITHHNQDLGNLYHPQRSSLRPSFHSVFPSPALGNHFSNFSYHQLVVSISFLFLFFFFCKNTFYFLKFMFIDFGKRGERNISLFYLFMHSLVDSHMCSNWRLNPQDWCTWTRLQPTGLPGQGYVH